MFGPIIELFTCNPRFYSAVEVVAGNSLFNVVVATDEVASQITQHLLRGKLGRVTFLPLNRLTEEPVVVPPTKDEMPMMKILALADRKYERAFSQIFGKVLICRDMDRAVEVSRAHRVNTVTMEGDSVNKNGSMEGGYESSTKRIELFRSIAEKAAAALEKGEAKEKVGANPPS